MTTRSGDSVEREQPSSAICPTCHKVHSGECKPGQVFGQEVGSSAQEQPAPSAGDHGEAGELLPCPFCGGEAEKKIGVAPEDWVNCTQCGASTRFGYGRAVVKLWNRRITPAQHAAETGDGEAMAGGR